VVISVILHHHIQDFFGKGIYEGWWIECIYADIYLSSVLPHSGSRLHFIWQHYKQVFPYLESLRRETGKVALEE
jgi:hypothetical protein